jgi:UDP-glucuronate decarboxylase
VCVKVARIFNTYGPRMLPYDGRVISTFVRQALRDEPLTVYGDGSQTRSFCYVDDLVDGLIALMDSEGEVTGPINLGNAEEVTVLRLAEEIIRITGSRSTIDHRPLPSDDPARRRPNVDAAWTALGWRPSTPLEAGLRATIEAARRTWWS